MKTVEFKRLLRGAMHCPSMSRSARCVLCLGLLRRTYLVGLGLLSVTSDVRWLTARQRMHRFCRSTESSANDDSSRGRSRSTSDGWRLHGESDGDIADVFGCSAGVAYAGSRLSTLRCVELKEIRVPIKMYAVFSYN